MKASVLICTHNRALLLEKVLEGLTCQTLPQGSFEVIVIDNASTDNTQDIAKVFVKRFKHFRYIFEGRLGVSIARNRGVNEAQGDIVVYYDDDQFLQPDSLKNLLMPLEGMIPKPDAVMGRVELKWEGGKSVGYLKNFETLLSRFDEGEAGHFLRSDRYFLTMNLAIRKNVLLGVGGFREDLGRIGKIPFSGEDNELFHRLIKKGHRVYYEPSALVHHWVGKERQTKRWLCKTLFGVGMSQAVLDKVNDADFSRQRLRRDLMGAFRRCARFFIAMMFTLLMLRRNAFWEATYNLVQRLGRLNMEWAISRGRYKQLLDQWRIG